MKIKDIIAKTCHFESEEQAAAYYAFVESIREKEDSMIVGGVNELLEASKGRLVFLGEMKETIYSFIGEGSGVLYTTMKNLAELDVELSKIQKSNPKIDFMILVGDEEEDYTMGAIFAKESCLA